jgi:hypothetical protein
MCEQDSKRRVGKTTLRNDFLEKTGEESSLVLSQFGKRPLVPSFPFAPPSKISCCLSLRARGSRNLRWALCIDPSAG